MEYHLNNLNYNALYTFRNKKKEEWEDMMTIAEMEHSKKDIDLYYQGKIVSSVTNQIVRYGER